MILWLFNLSLGLSVLFIVFIENWFLIWVFIELVTALLVLLASGGLSPRVVEAISKYFVTQAIASIILLLGIMVRIYTIGEVGGFSSYNNVSLAFILSGLFIKIAVFPNPFWFVDVINGVGIKSGVYFVVVSKLVPLYLYISLSQVDRELFFIVGGLGAVVVGSIYAINQTSLRKIIALSSVAHLGWLVLGIPYLTFSTCIVLFIIYLLMVGPLLWIVGLYQIDDLNSTKHVYFNSSFLLIIILSLLSLGGLPPLAGFAYKWVIFLGLFNAGKFLVCVLLVLMSVVSLFFYLRLCFSFYSSYLPETFPFFFGVLMSSNMGGKSFLIFIVGTCIVMLGGLLLMGPLTFTLLTW
uniref:NADH-ubiquinone oxidoreductase chain 2 n=1 Tax=Ophiomonas sp. TaxID=3135530 RepID=A0AAU6PX10_9ECHI